MSLQALGYVGVGASDLGDWSRFATDWLGMQMLDKSATCRAFRMDDRRQRLIVDRALGEGALFRLGSRRRRGLAIVWRRGWRRAAWRCGTNRRRWRISAACGADLVRRSRSATGWRPSTEPLSPTKRSGPGARSPASAPARLAWGSVFHVKRMDDLLGFYRDVLGFGVSDYIRRRSGPISCTSIRAITAWR